MKPKLHLSFLLISQFASKLRWRFICCLFTLDSFSSSIPIPLTPSQEPVPHPALIRQFLLLLWALPSICGCQSQSPHQGSIPRRDLDTQRCHHQPPLFPHSHVGFFRNQGALSSLYSATLLSNRNFNPGET